MPNHRPYNGNDAHRAAFDLKHGVSIYEDGMHRYANGALREGSYWGGMLEPPEDKVRCQDLIIKYWAVYVAQGKREFDYKKAEYTRQSSNMGQHELDAAEKELKALRKLVKNGRKQHEAAELEMLRLRYKTATVEEALKLKEDRERRIAEGAYEHNERANAARARISNIRV